MQTSISPVAVYPATANTLMIRSITLGPPPSYYYELQEVQVVQKQRDVPNPAYVPADLIAGTPAQGQPIITETYNDQQVTVLKNGNVSMTEQQWNAWGIGASDDDYQLNAITSNLGLTRA